MIGGTGSFKGGEGIRRDVKFLSEAQVTILSDRRKYPPYGLRDGRSGRTGENILIGKDGRKKKLPPKISFTARPGDTLRILTPGGGGYGAPLRKK